VLVLVPAPQPGAQLGADAQVTVKGVVRPFFVTDLRRDYDWFGLDQDLVVALEDRPVIVAESVRNEAGREFVETSAGAERKDAATSPAGPAEPRDGESERSSEREGRSSSLRPEDAAR
jgi:hypothetical protein